MGLVYKIDGVEFEIKEFEFNEPVGTVDAIAKNSNGFENTLRFPYPLPLDTKFKKNQNDFIIYLFYKDNFAANDIYEVTISEINIGWLFPIDALNSSEHDYASNEHFFPYSENAIKKLLKGDDNIPSSSPNLSDEHIGRFEDFYGPNSIILILYKDYLLKLSTKVGRSFKIQEYQIYLYGFGYTYLTNENFSQFQAYKANNLPNYKTPNGKDLNLKPISSLLLEDIDFINLVFRGLLKFESHHLIRFHLLYQIIELLIAKIFETEFHTLMPEFSVSKKVFDAREKLNGLVNEKKRINKLFNTYSSCNNLEELKVTCSNLINQIEPEEIAGHAESLYKVRSLMFHNYRDIPIGKENILNQINEEFEQAVISLIINFKTPNLVGRLPP